MAQVIARNRNKRSKINNTDMLINEMQKRKNPLQDIPEYEHI
jgi:hypothetical protein